MGLFGKIFDSNPAEVKDVVTKIKAYFVGINPDLVKVLQNEAIFYAEKESNYPKIQQAFSDGKDAEFLSLMFIYLGTQDAIARGEFHIYSGMVTADGNAACAIACDCIDRLAYLGHYEKNDAEARKSNLKNMLTDIGIG